MDLLARREHSRLELYQKLKQKKFEPNIINTELDKLSNEGLQSDERFAEAFLRSRIDKGKGPNIILSELLQRGVDELLVSNVLESISEGQWCEVAYETMNKKLGNESELDYDKQLKLMKFLNNRGFTRSQIERAKNLLSEKSTAKSNENE
jgi:regulatory protein